VLSNFFKSVRSNHLFTPFALLLVISGSYYFLNLNFIEKNYAYSYLVALTGIVFIFKTLVLTFGEVEENKRKFKWFLIGVQLILAGVSIYLSFLAINYLTNKDTYPQVSVGYLFFAEGIYAIQLFLAKIKGFLPITLATFVVYSCAYIALYNKLFVAENERFLLMQQAVSIFILTIGIVHLFAVLKIYIDHKKTEPVEID
jgi:hypothetical protein